MDAFVDFRGRVGFGGAAVSGAIVEGEAAAAERWEPIWLLRRALFCFWRRWTDLL